MSSPSQLDYYLASDAAYFAANDSAPAIAHKNWGSLIASALSE